MSAAVIGPEDKGLIEDAKAAFRLDYGYLLKVIEAARTRRTGRANLKAVK